MGTFAEESIINTDFFWGLKSDTERMCQQRITREEHVVFLSCSHKKLRVDQFLSMVLRNRVNLLKIADSHQNLSPGEVEASGIEARR